jgi:serine/threonine-protein kinase RIO1
VDHPRARDARALAPGRAPTCRGRSAEFIDFPQAIDARTNPNSYEFLRRDIDNVTRFFARYGVRSDPVRLTEVLWHRYLFARL